MPLVLASSSPRRAELLAQLGVEAVIEPADVDETPFAVEAPAAYVERVARAKADAVLGRHRGDGAVVLAADTTVTLAGEIMGKPGDVEHARQMLRRLSGREHEVLTGVAVGVGEHVASDVATSRVSFAALGEDDIAAYVRSGEPMDKAGAYALQGAASMFVTAIDGPIDNVIGLPRLLTRSLFHRLGMELSDYVGG